MNNTSGIFPSLTDILGQPISREQALSLIPDDYTTQDRLKQLSPASYKKLLSFLQGNSGLLITYDNFFKKIFDPLLHPNRIQDFLSCILQKEIKTLQILPLEGIKLSDTGTFVMMDIVIETTDGEIIDVEMQKIGYHFPGQRSDCYASDFIMRQYNRIKAQKGKTFTYQDLKPIYIIILMEQSSSEFKNTFPAYIHREIRSYDSGADVRHLSKNIYISLDVFKSVVHNITNKLDAWLTFLSSDKPEDIINLVSAYPAFIDLYHDIAEFRKDPKELIYMYSEALSILDRNTAFYMIDEKQKEIEDLQALVAEQTTSLAEKENTLTEKENALAEKETTIAALQAEIARLKKNQP